MHDLRPVRAPNNLGALAATMAVSLKLMSEKPDHGEDPEGEGWSIVRIDPHLGGKVELWKNDITGEQVKHIVICTKGGDDNASDESGGEECAGR